MVSSLVFYGIPKCTSESLLRAPFLGLFSFSLCFPFLFICFCFILFYSYPLDACFFFLTRVRKGVNSDGRGVGEELEREEGRESENIVWEGVVYFQ